MRFFEILQHNSRGPANIKTLQRIPKCLSGMTYPNKNHVGYPWMLLFSINNSSLSLMIDSSILHVMQVRLTGLQFPRSVRSPFLYIGIILPCF